MSFNKQEALDLCPTCGSGRPNFYKNGAYEPNCFWSFENTPSRRNIPNVDNEDKGINHFKTFHDMRMNKLVMGQKEAKLVSAVQVARQRYVHISDRESGKDVNCDDNSSMASYWSIETPDQDTDTFPPDDRMLTNDDHPNMRQPTPAMIALNCFHKGK
jgi:hypothetical protein